MIGIRDEYRRSKPAEQKQPGSAGDDGGIRAQSSPTYFTRLSAGAGKEGKCCQGFGVAAKGRRGGSDRAEVQRRTDVRRGGGGIFEEQRHQSALPRHVESCVAAVSIAQDVKPATVWWRGLLRFTPPAALVSVLAGTGVGGNHGSVFGTP